MKENNPAKTIIKNGIEIGAPTPSKPTAPTTPTNSAKITDGLEPGKPTPKKK